LRTEILSWGREDPCSADRKLRLFVTPGVNPLVPSCFILSSLNCHPEDDEVRLISKITKIKSTTQQQRDRIFFFDSVPNPVTLINL
jgi:hypothetical protein